MATKTLSIKLNLNIKDFSKNLKVATKQVSQSMKKIGKSVSDMGKRMSIGITLPAVLAGGAMVKLASDAQEADAKFKQVFGKSAKEATKNINAMASAMGRSETDLKGFGSNMGGIIQNMGFTSDEATELSHKMIQLGIDTASFNDVSDSQAVNAFTSALVGEREALKTLGVSILESDVKLEALRMGLVKGKETLTKRAKALATISLLEKNFAKAMGATAREANGFSNTLKRLQASAKKLGETLGGILLPFAVDLLNTITPMINVVSQLDPVFQKWGLAIIGVAVVLGPLLIVVGSMATALGALMPALIAIGTAFVTIIAPMLLLASAVVIVIGAWDDLMLAGKTLWTTLQSFFTTGIGNVITTLLFPWMPSVKQILGAYKFLTGGTQSWVKDMVGVLVKLVEGVANLLVAPFIAQLNLLIWAYNKTIGKFGEKIEYASFTPFSGKAKIAFDKIKKFGTKAFEEIGSASTTAFKDLKLSGEEAMKRLKDRFLNGLDKIGLSTDGVKSKFKSLFDMMKKGPDLSHLTNFGSNKGFLGEDQSQTTPFTGSGVSAIQTDDSQGGGGGGTKIGGSGVPADITKVQEFVNEGLALAENMKAGWLEVFDSMAQGFGNAMATMIVDGESFKDVMTDLWKGLVSQIISMIGQMLIKWLLAQAVQSATAKTKAVSEITTASGVAFANGVASWAGAPWPINLGAPAFGASMQASAMSGLGSVALASGGITTGPTNALIGEAGQEAVIPLDKLDSIVGEKTQTINIDLDGRRIAQSVIKNSPREIRLRTGVVM